MRLRTIKDYLNHSRYGKIVIRIGSYAHTIFSIVKFTFHRELRRFGYVDCNLIEVKKYAKLHKNKRCFIIATGPSLRLTDLENLKDEITFSMNSICQMFDKTDWRPTYYGIQDEVGLDRVKDNLTFENKPVYLFNSKFRRKIMSDTSFTKGKNILFFPLRYGLHGSRLDFRNRTNGFSNDAYVEVVDGYTITYSLIQIAVYMGIKEVYLLGVDNSYSKPGPKHFVDHDGDKNVTLDKWELIEKRMSTAYLEASKYANQNGIKIYNASRGGQLEIFERVNLDQIVNSEPCCKI